MKKYVRTYSDRVKKSLHKRLGVQAQDIITEAENQGGILNRVGKEYLLDKGGNLKELGLNQDTGYKTFASISSTEFIHRCEDVPKDEDIHKNEEIQLPWVSRIFRDLPKKAFVAGLTAMMTLQSALPTYALSSDALTRIARLREKTGYISVVAKKDPKRVQQGYCIWNERNRSNVDMQKIQIPSPVNSGEAQSLDVITENHFTRKEAGRRIETRRTPTFEPMITYATPVIEPARQHKTKGEFYQDLTSRLRNTYATHSSPKLNQRLELDFEYYNRWTQVPIESLVNTINRVKSIRLKQDLFYSLMARVLSPYGEEEIAYEDSVGETQSHASNVKQAITFGIGIGAMEGDPKQIANKIIDNEGKKLFFHETATSMKLFFVD